MEVAPDCPNLKFLIQMESEPELGPGGKMICDDKIKLVDYNSILALVCIYAFEFAPSYLFASGKAKARSSSQPILRGWNCTLQTR